MKLFLSLALLFIFAVSALAEEKGDCGPELRAYVYGPWAIAKGMADYRAAMDAGYEVCSEKDPEKFEGTAETYDLLRGNTEKEMEQAMAVLDYLIAHPDAKKVSEECIADDGARESLRAEVHAAIDGQYSKAFERRHKALSSGEPADSCGLVLEMVKQYGENLGKYEQLQHVLYESSKKQGKIILTGSERKNSFRNFEKTREKISAFLPSPQRGEGKKF